LRYGGAGDKLLGRGRSWSRQYLNHRRPIVNRLSIRWRVDARNRRSPALIIRDPRANARYVANAITSISRDMSTAA